MNRRALLPNLLFVTITALVGIAPSQQPPADHPPADQQAVEKLTEWPTLKSTEQDRVHALVGQFRKPDAKLHEDAKKQLAEIGPGAAPILMKLVSDRPDNVNEPLFAVLDGMIQAQHVAMLAREGKNPRGELRRYLMRRLCQFADPDLRAVFQAALQDKDEMTAFYAALGLLAQQQQDGLAKVLATAKTHWPEVGPLVAKVLPNARSAECGNWVFEKIADASANDRMAGLRLLRYLMVKDQGIVLRTYLNASDHTVKREAVNTARVLHGEEPIENLSVFQAIEMAKKWLEKV